MSIASLTACLQLDRPNAGVLGVARHVAKRFGSRVIGLAAKQASIHVAGRGVGPSEPHEHELQKFKDCARTVEEEFRSLFPNGDENPWRAQLTFGPASEFIAADARSADLIVISTGRHELLLFPSGHPEPGDLLMRLGRPLLCVPEGVSALPLTHALICWKDSREARRAIVDAVPLLQAAERVDVVEIVEPRRIEDAEARLSEIAAWLAGHRIEASCAAETSHGPESVQLGEIARARGADLIVAGAFGHSRLREWAFGGVTRDLVLNSDRCVLASH